MLNGSLDLDQRDVPLHGKSWPEARQGGSAMRDKIDDLLPTAREIQKQTALKEAEKAEQYARWNGLRNLEGSVEARSVMSSRSQRVTDEISIRVRSSIERAGLR